MSTINVNALDKESGSTLTLGGVGTTVAVHASATTSGFDSGLASAQYFTSSGTWNRPTGITKVVVEVQGAGSSGIRGAALAGRYAGGAGGGYARKVIDVSSISTATITVGTGGAATNSSTTGNAGGSSIWADGTNTLTAGGGGGGLNTSYYGGVGGTATGGDLNIAGQNGGAYARRSGGNSQFGYGGIYGGSAASGSDPDNDGIPPVGYGSGSVAVYNGTTDAGAPGIVIVTEYK